MHAPIKKIDAIRMAYLPNYGLDTITDELIESCVENLSVLPDQKIIKMLRKSCDLNFCSFAPGLLYIKY